MPMGMMMWAKKVVPYLIVAADGSGDYTDIQAAHDALPATGGQIYVKAGTYTITSAITITKDNVSIFGVGKATKIVTTANINMIDSTAGADWLKIRSIWFYGAGDGNNTNYGINFTGTAVNVEIKECWVENCGKQAIVGSQGEKCIIKENYVYSNFDTGIQLTLFNNGYIIDNIVYDNKGHGIAISLSDNNFLLGNTCNDNDLDNTTTYSGIILVTADRNVLVSNRCRDNDNYEIHIATATCNDNKVIGNVCVGTDREGAIEDDGTDTVLSHNTTG